MNMIPKYCMLFRSAALCSVLLCTLFLIGTTYAADPKEEETVQAEDAVPIEIKESTSDYTYQVDSRPDPFAPFVSGPAKKNPVKPDEIVENEEVLTGMQLFEPGQLTLVGLMMTGGETVAMVQDFTGRGYVVEAGMKIGRHGVITDINENKVLITETRYTRSGKTLTNEIPMVLKREGEE